MPGEGNKTARRGFALVVVLLIIMAIAVLAMGFLSRSDVELACGENMILKTQMDYLAESALEHAKGLILNPQDVTSEYWTGAAGQQLFVGSNDYYDVNVTKLGELNYQITSTAYRETGSERVSSSSLTANLRLDPAIGFWSGSAVSFYPNTNIGGDVYCNGVLNNSGTINGDCFADSLIGNAITGMVNPKTALQLSRPTINSSILTTNFATQTIHPSNLNNTTLNSSTQVYYKDRNLEIKSSVNINGCLAVDGNLTISGSSNVITAQKSVPAIYVSGDLILKPDSAITITGLVLVDGQVKMSIVNQSMSVTGALFTNKGIQYNKTIPDYSGNGYDGIINGDCNFIPSPLGGAVKFDGDRDYIDVDYISGGALLLPDKYSVALWFRADGGAGSHRDLFSATNAGLQHGFLLELRDTNVLRYVHRHSFSACGTGDVENIYTTTTYGDGLWHHVVAVRASDNSRLLYVDGQQVGSNSNATTAFDAPLRVILGGIFSSSCGGASCYDQGGRWWNGAIDDVRVYNKALSQANILSIMSGGEPASGNLVAYWKMDGGGGCVMTINAAPTKAAIYHWPGGVKDRWSPAAGAFFKAIGRQ